MTPEEALTAFTKAERDAMKPENIIKQDFTSV